MNKLITPAKFLGICFLALFLTTNLQGQAITSYPYRQNFESSDGGFVPGGNNASFAWGTPAGIYINSAASGTKAWTTGLTTQYNNSENGFAISPSFDLSGFGPGTAPILELKVWWDCETSHDNANMKYTVNGSNSQVLGYAWYNRSPVWFVGPMKQDCWNGTGNSGSGGWVTVRQSLAGITGNDVVFLVNFASDSYGIVGDGFAFDDFSIFDFNTYVDAKALSAEFTVGSSCGLSGMNSISTKIENVGGAVLTNVPVSYSVNGAPPITEIVAGPINPGITFTYTFATQVNVGVPNTYNVVVNAAATGDGDATNNTTNTTVTKSIVVNTFPYLQDFELGQGGFYISPAIAKTSFEWGTPAGVYINSAASGTKAWTTSLVGLYNPFERGYVQSPCFDFTNVPNPELKLKIWWNSQYNYDNTNIKYSTDGGLTFRILGSVNDPSWYNRSALGFIGYMKEDCWNNSNTNTSSGGWVQKRFLASNLGGQASVIFRICFSSDMYSPYGDGFAFDDFAINSAVPQVSPFALVAPAPNATINVAGVPSQSLNMKWRRSSSNFGLPVTYTWLADLPGGNFSNPILSLPANNTGRDTILTVPYTNLNNLLAARGLGIGDTLKLIWTVQATDGMVLGLASANFLALRRGQLVSNVTFKVNMSSENIINPNGVHIAGEMNGFNPSSPALATSISGIYSITLPLSIQDVVEYKFFNGNTLGDAELVPTGCALAGTQNRFVVVPIADDLTLPVVCFSKCSNCVVASNDLGFENGISLYPNPTNSNTLLAFDLEQASDVTITLYNTIGEVLQRQSEKGIQTANIPLNTSELPNGIYFIHINNGNQYAVKQLMMQK